MNRICDRLTSGYGRPTENVGANRAGPRPTLVGVAPNMTTDTPQARKSAGSERSGEQIAHAVCHDCPRFEDLYRAPTAAEAKAEAVEDAIEHARASGHHNVDTQLLTEPGFPICGRCYEPLHGRVCEGPSPADATNQPCGCTPTEVSD